MSLTYLEAIREAQAKLLRDNDRVFIYGQDVGGTFGGAFKATKGLAKEFPGRVLNTPISEDAIVGTAIGAAMQGMRPIVEMQFADFSSIALNQILNNEMPNTGVTVGGRAYGWYNYVKGLPKTGGNSDYNTYQWDYVWLDK